jgi:hypothetical protein
MPNAVWADSKSWAQAFDDLGGLSNLAVMPSNTSSVPARIAAPVSSGVILHEVQNTARPATCRKSLPIAWSEQFDRLVGQHRKRGFQWRPRPNNNTFKRRWLNPQLCGSHTFPCCGIYGPDRRSNRLIRGHSDPIVSRDQGGQGAERIAQIMHISQRRQSNERLGDVKINGAKPGTKVSNRREVIVDINSISPKRIDESKRSRLVGQHPLTEHHILRQR